MGKRDRGFSLIELIIAIAILLILTGLLAPQFMKYIERTRQAKMIHTLDNFYQGLTVSYVEALEKSHDLDTRDNFSIKFGEPINGSHSSVEYVVSEILNGVFEKDELKSTWIMAYFDSDGNRPQADPEAYYFTGVLINYYPDTNNLEHCYYYRTGVMASEETGMYGEYTGGKYIPWK